MRLFNTDGQKNVWQIDLYKMIPSVELVPSYISLNAFWQHQKNGHDYTEADYLAVASFDVVLTTPIG